VAADVRRARERAQVALGRESVEVREVREHCRVKEGVTAEHPFGPDPLVMKVAGRIFAIIDEHADPATISLKCDPGLVQVLRDAYFAVSPGYHLDKRHWNTVALDGTVPDVTITDWIDDSYDLVVDKLPKYVQRRLDWAAVDAADPP
jgi:predicted DNA-binding protein (MmcQ/YjbR family)